MLRQKSILDYLHRKLWIIKADYFYSLSSNGDIVLLDIESVAKCIAMYNINPPERIGITKFKSMFVDRWGIFEGATVLEVGCGQGDTTAVLAEAVGVDGHIIATDPANPNYGSPITIGEAANFLSNSRLGSRISFHFNSNICDPQFFLTHELFDFVVLAHCSYYFDSRENLLNTFVSAKKWAKTLCFSEWDVVASNMQQISHLLAIFIQGQVEAFKLESTANIRSPFSKQEVESLLDKSGWIITDDFKIDSLQMQEYVTWEVAICLERLLEETNQLKIPKKLYDTIRWQIDALARYNETYPVEPLPSYSIIARSK